MSESARSRRPETDAEPHARAPAPTSPNRAAGSTSRHQPDTDPEELLSLLSDDYARRVLETVVDDPLPAREIATRLDASRATVYRRLDRLEEAGLVESTMTYDPDGHHRKQFRTTLDRVLVSFDDDGIAVDPSA